MSVLTAGATFGPFRIEGYVAGGGMGQVYAATHAVYGHPVALKVLHEPFSADPRWHRRFSEEGLLGLQLKHPHVLSARELVEHEGRLALVMDLVSGGQNLLKVMDRDWPTGLPLGQALLVFLRIVSGVEYLHDRKLVHGDLKPENVLIDGALRDPAAWAPKVTDFGTLALIADPVTIDGRAAVVASPRYASPEHLRGVDQLTEVSDVYALGLLLHFLLCGHHASGARTIAEAARQVAGPISLVYVVDQPDPLLGILERATHPEPGRRYASCRDLALAIRDALDELGLGLQLDDLQAELATEVVEDRAQAQRALYHGADDASQVSLGEPLPAEPAAAEGAADAANDDDAGDPGSPTPPTPRDAELETTAPTPPTPKNPTIRPVDAPALPRPLLPGDAPPTGSLGPAAIILPVLTEEHTSPPRLAVFEPPERGDDAPTEPVNARVIVRPGSTPPAPPREESAADEPTPRSLTAPGPKPAVVAALPRPTPKPTPPPPPSLDEAPSRTTLFVLVGAGAALGVAAVIVAWALGWWP
jgi:serine/threonine protein kinase